MEDITLSHRLKRHGPPACLRDRVSTSARRWEQHGVWRTIWLMWRLRAAYFLGADPARLASSMDMRHDRVEYDLGRVQVAVLAKAPLAGLAKTRLIPALGPRGAARLQRQFTRSAVRTAQAPGSDRSRCGARPMRATASSVPCTGPPAWPASHRPAATSENECTRRSVSTARRGRCC